MTTFRFLTNSSVWVFSVQKKIVSYCSNSSGCCVKYIPMFLKSPNDYSFPCLIYHPPTSFSNSLILWPFILYGCLRWNCGELYWHTKIAKPAHLFIFIPLNSIHLWNFKSNWYQHFHVDPMNTCWHVHFLNRYKKLAFIFY